MRPLPSQMTVPLGVGESPASFVSRTAAQVGRVAQDFCLDMGLSFQGIVDGDEELLNAVADLCRADPELLRRNALVRQGNRFLFMGQTFTREALERRRLHICPTCLSEDIKEGLGPAETRPYGRSVWFVAPIRTCFLHHAPLTSLGHEQRPRYVHDFAHIMSASISHLDAMVEQAGSRTPSNLEKYLVGRLEGSTPGFPWLDELPFYAAAKACHVMGAVAEFGAKVQLLALSETEWHRAGATGFEFASKGEAGILDLLARLQESFFATKHDWGPGQMFGRLYHWLAHESDDPAYEPLRTLIRDYVVSTMPVGPGEMILGREVAKRRCHSVQSASEETGMHPKRLRNLLQAAGYIRNPDRKLTNERILFDAEAIREFLSTVADSMPLNEARAYINAPRLHDRMLLDNGFIRSLLPGGAEKGINFVISRRELDSFLARLLEGAEVADTPSGQFAQIPLAAKKASCSAMKIVGLILDRKLRPYQLAGERGYLSVLVNVEVLKQLVRAPRTEQISLRDAERMLKVSGPVLVNLIDNGILPARKVVNPVTNLPQRVVTPKDLQTFQSRYISLQAWARERGTSMPRLNQILKRSGVSPAFDPEIILATFYERSAVAEFPAA